jgi:hypothetical protein
VVAVWKSELDETLRDATKNAGVSKVRLGTKIAALFRGLRSKPCRETRELRDRELLGRAGSGMNAAAQSKRQPIALRDMMIAGRP